jgi:hypothetical protein
MTTNFNTIADILIIKQYIDKALDASYEDRHFQIEFNALGSEIYIYINTDGEAALTASKMGVSYVLTNCEGDQARVIDHLLN